MDNGIFRQVRLDYPEAIFLSALNSLKVDDLRLGILQKLQQEEIKVEIELSLNDMKAIALIRDNGVVLKETYNDESIRMECLCYKRVWNWLERKLRHNVETAENSKR
jgi:GTP-binding protein HflX